MANIKNLEMAKAISAHPHVQFEKSFLGLRTTAVYQPTQSIIDAHQQDYTSDEGLRLERVLKADDVELALRKAGKIAKADISNMRLELCLSRDRQFAAVQLFRFADFQYHPATDIRFFEGEEAGALAALL